MDKEEPNLSTWGDISDSELVPEAAKIQKKNTKNNKKNVASRSLRETSQETKNKCHCKKTNRPPTIFHGPRSYTT